MSIITRRKRGLLGATLALGIASAILIPAASASASSRLAPYQLETADPQATGCSADARTIARYPMTDGYGNFVTWEDVRYSPSCGTNWIRVVDPFADQQNYVQLEVLAGPDVTIPTTYNSDPAAANPADYPTFGSGDTYWSGMTYAPGSTCITFNANITDYRFAPLAMTPGGDGVQHLC